MSFANKIVIVTGASSGIGAATANLFAKEGANVVLVGRNQDRLHNILKQCEENGKDHLAVIADVSKEDDAKRIINNAIDKFGKIDVLINNAGIVRFANIFDKNVMEVYDTIMSTNLRASIYLTHLATPHLIKTKGNIVNVSSIAGTMVPMPAVNSYAVSKAAVNHFTRGVAGELASHGVRVNTVSPGPVKTDIMENSNLEVPIDLSAMQTPLGRVSESTEIADLILFVASDKAKAITGSDFVSDNGVKFELNISFANKIVIVTGASSGIGAATANLFAKEGANVVLVGRNQDRLHNILKQCEENGKEHLAVIADVSKEDDAKRIINNAIDKFGKLDVLVNNAGIVRFANIFDKNVMEVYDTIMSTNLRASIYLTHLAAPHLIETKGNIVNVSSIAATLVAMPTMNYYNVSKAALNHFTRGVAGELASHGVRVNTVSPGPVKTDIMENSNLEVPIDLSSIPTPLGRVSESQEIADLILFIASDKAKAITGSDFISDNGIKVKF